MKLRSMWMCACVLALAGCDDDVEPVEDGGGAGTSGMGGTGGSGGAAGGSGASTGGSGGDAGSAAGGAAGAAGEGGSAGGAPESWYVWVIVERFSHVNRTGEKAQASALVARREQAGPGVNYTKIDEHCNVLQGRWIKVSEPWPHLGAMTIDRPDADDVDLSLQDDQYSAGNVAPLWEPGEALTVSAASGDLPGFTFTFTFPASISPTLPKFEEYDDAEFVVKRSVPLLFAWEPVDVPVRIQLNQYDSLGTSQENAMTAVRCVFPGEDGAGALPPEALTYLEAADLVGPQMSSSLLYIGQDATQTHEEGNVVYELDAWNGIGLPVNVE